MGVDKNQLADVLETTATFLDAQATEKTAAIREERSQVVSTFAEKYASSTGEELPEKVREQLIGSDENLMSAFEKMAGAANRHNQEPEDMGVASNHPDEATAPTTVKEAADQAGDAFVKWVMND
jgi:hypothetical protein